MADSLREEFAIHLCRYRSQLLMIVGLLGACLVLSIAATRVIQPGTGSYVLNVMNIVGLSVFLLAFGAAAVYCHRTEERLYR